MIDWLCLGAPLAIATWALARAGQRLVRRPAVRWPAALVLALTAAGWGAWQLSRARTFQVAGELVARVPTDEPLVALTLDDGPTPEYTHEVLQILAEAGVPATFFVTGEALERDPALGRAIVASGHELGNHSYSHHRMVGLSSSFIADEIERTDRLIRASGWRGDILFRPPFGKKLIGLPIYLARRGTVTVTWDVEPESDVEVARDARAITEHVLARVRPGSIVLLHVMFSSGDASRRALRPVIAGLRARGYGFATVSELRRRADSALRGR